MSDIIRLLPDAVANQIAAGEVIQRPASVVKELVENAIDAGATHIDTKVVDAGKTSIQVIDDGKGMSETDARMAFERHATSKIKKATDLFALHTMGFRGEALASIAAVAQVELRTRMPDQEVGTFLQLSGSKVTAQEVIATPVGSNFMVKNLFFNIPARRKFLKSNQTELNNILYEFERIVLVHHGVSFNLYHNDTELFSLPEASFKQRIVHVFGKNMDKHLLPLQVDTSLIQINGFVGKPEAARKKGAKQFFFVNGRYMRHPYFHKAITDAYEKLIPNGEQVPYFLHFTVNPSNIDVNIHPSKTEIKFDNESSIWQILAAAIRQTLGKFNAVPSIDFDVEGMPDIPVYDAHRTMPSAPPQIHLDPTYNPFAGHSAESASARRAESTHWQPLYEGYERHKQSDDDPLAPPPDYAMWQVPPAATEHTPEANAEPAQAIAPSQPEGIVQLQYKGRYILTSIKSGLMLIDQHRAHICVLYDRYLHALKDHKGVSQRLIFPEIWQVPMSEQPTLQALLPDLQALGFDLQDLGRGSLAINGIPSGIEGIQPVQLLEQMIQDAIDRPTNLKEEQNAQLALSLARSAAIPTGRTLSQEEMNHLIGELFQSSSPNYTPEGKRVLYILNDTDLERLFR